MLQLKKQSEALDMSQFYQIHENEFYVVHHDHMTKFPSHMHDEVEILYMLDGEQGININNETATLHKGDCAVIFPNTQHEYLRPDEMPGKNSAGESVMIFVASHIFYYIFPNMHNMTPVSCILNSSEISENATFAFNKIINENVSTARLGWVYIILGHIVPKLNISEEKLDLDSSAISRLMNYISTNFQNSITLEILSDALGMSKSQISHIFSDKIRISLRSYIGIRRSEYAAQLIRTSNDTLSNIAMQSGFESLRTFNRVFREVYGVTPSQFRNNIRKFTNRD